MAIALGILAIAGLVYLVYGMDVDVTDAIVAIEVAFLVVLGLPLSVRGTIRLIVAVRGSTADDRLARAVTVYFSLVSISALWLTGLTLYRFYAGQPAADWTRPISGLLLFGVLVGPWYIDRVAGADPAHRHDAAE